MIDKSEMIFGVRAVIDPILFALPLSVLAIVGISLLTYKKY